MKISRNWLLDYVDFNEVSHEEYSELITTRVAEIEAVYEVAAPLKYAQIVQILSVEKHPNKDTLTIVKVGSKDGEFSVVSGAKNLRVGMHTAMLFPGSYVRKPDLSAEEEFLLPVEKRDVSGIESYGRICSESELGIGPTHDSGPDAGILDCSAITFGSDVKTGEMLSSYLGGPDLIIDIDNKSLTHRPDLWSHFGFAREISAIFKKPIIKDYDKQVNYNNLVPNEFKDLKQGRFTNEISDPERCFRFTLLEISNLKNHRSPQWLRRRLFSVGSGVRNVLVDLSNYVLNDVGQPNHAFDATLLRGNRLYARRANVDESFIALDEIERNLDPEDLVIADEQGPLDLAGVIGGRDFSVNIDTDSVVLVSSAFDAVAIRKTCKRHQVRTDSSSRYEKSLSPVQTTLSMLVYVELLRQIGQSPKLLGFSDAPQFKVPKKVNIPYSKLEIQNRLQGVPETTEEIHSILTNLNFEIKDNQATVPYYRATKDISISADLIEEVGRSIGYDRVPELAPLIATKGSVRSPQLKYELDILQALQGMGYSEVYNYTFSSKENLNKLGYATTDVIELQNSVDQTLSAVRTSLVPGMFEVAEKNIRYQDNFSVFEIGRAYHLLGSAESENQKIEEPIERRLLSILSVNSSSGNKSANLQSNNQLVQSGDEFYGVVESIKRIGAMLHCKEIEIIPIKSESSPTKPTDFCSLKYWMHPWRAATISIGGLNCGVVAQVRPSLVNKKNSNWVIAELDIQAMVATINSKISFKQIPKFPTSFFEVSILIDSKAYFSDIRSKLVSQMNNQKFLREIKPVSLYEGKGLPDNMKSLSLQFVFADSENTISGDQLNELREDVLKSINHSGFQLRT